MSGIGNIKSVFLDTAIFIYYLEANPEFGQKSKQVFTTIVNKNKKAYTSVITLSEILSAPFVTDSDYLRDQFFQTPNLKVLIIEAQIAIEAARIRRQYKFKLGDSLQLATAIITKSEGFITNDASLTTFKELKIILLKEI